jgi:hypothetical protein
LKVMQLKWCERQRACVLHEVQLDWAASREMVYVKKHDLSYFCLHYCFFALLFVLLKLLFS